METHADVGKEKKIGRRKNRRSKRLLKDIKTSFAQIEEDCADMPIIQTA